MSFTKSDTHMIFESYTTWHLLDPEAKIYCYYGDESEPPYPRRVTCTFRAVCSPVRFTNKDDCHHGSVGVLEVINCKECMKTMLYQMILLQQTEL